MKNKIIKKLKKLAVEINGELFYTEDVISKIDLLDKLNEIIDILNKKKK